MKSFRSFLNEEPEHKSVATLNSPTILDDNLVITINNNLTWQLKDHYITPQIALQTVRRILAPFFITLNFVSLEGVKDCIHFHIERAINTGTNIGTEPSRCLRFEWSTDDAGWITATAAIVLSADLKNINEMSLSRLQRYNEKAKNDLESKEHDHEALQYLIRLTKTWGGEPTAARVKSKQLMRKIRNRLQGLEAVERNQVHEEALEEKYYTGAKVKFKIPVHGKTNGTIMRPSKDEHGHPSFLVDIGGIAPVNVAVDVVDIEDMTKAGILNQFIRNRRVNGLLGRLRESYMDFMDNKSHRIEVHNPTVSSLRPMLQHSKFKQLRYLKHGRDVWVWDADKKLHGTMADELGLADEWDDKVESGLQTGFIEMSNIDQIKNLRNWINARHNDQGGYVAANYEIDEPKQTVLPFVKHLMHGMKNFGHHRNIHELSNNTLGSYVKKAKGTSTSLTAKEGDFKRYLNRMKTIDKIVDKQIIKKNSKD